MRKDRNPNYIGERVRCYPYDVAKPQGASQMEGPRPTQSQTLGSGGVGLLLGAAQLLEAAIRWSREINASATGLRRVVMDNSVLSRFEAPQIDLGITPQIPNQREAVKDGEEEFGPRYLPIGLGTDPGSARGILSWNPLSNARKDRDENKRSLPRYSVLPGYQVAGDGARIFAPPPPESRRP